MLCRVRREELHASDESSWSESEVDAELEARLNAQIAKSLGIDESAYRPPQPPVTLPALSSDSESEPDTPVGDSTPSDQGGEEAEDEGYAFRLFSTAGPAPKVVLEDYDKVVEGKILRGPPLSYYLATDVSPEKKREYEVAAVSGEDVLARSKVRHWGLELPWKVTSIKTTRKARPGEAVNHDAQMEGEQQARRKRPGKKSRIAMRKKARAQAQAEEEAKKKMADKEEQIKEKKKRLNRLKKLRRRAQKKAEKGENGEGGGGGGGGGSGEGSSDEE
ncbi:hypothetical protein BBK36DRAFT_1183802 [Trichoderma citrinoviride]|uniref:Uncharacterized protein n=1 Tax=Trichoderma citrinoviride TaxID=58853 RepID=A0A2T4B0N3_9HYPO|nr:hypothetical protein BBK36DRAFT_1183802 [Trichoderma citrinoviride]PTB62882.1 hypothetical protein BBK36DRAFT_1183802 [Trichoderma citrinoviride]